MSSSSDPVRVPVAFFNVLLLACPLAVLAIEALGVPAVVMNLEGPVTATLLTAYGGERVQWATAICAGLALLQLAAIRDPVRGNSRRPLGIALAVLAFFAGLYMANASYRVGLVPLAPVETLPRTGAYVGAFAGLIYSMLAFSRLGRFGEPDPTATQPVVPQPKTSDGMPVSE